MLKTLCGRKEYIHGTEEQGVLAGILHLWGEKKQGRKKMCGIIVEGRKIGVFFLLVTTSFITKWMDSLCLSPFLVAITMCLKLHNL